jgi:UDP-N-acetylmuramate dehydrogenase
LLLKIEILALLNYLILKIMLRIEENISLKNLNTFGIEANCNYYTEIYSINDFLELLKTEIYRNNEHLIIGGGSNILLTQNFKGLVIRICLKGKEIIQEDENFVTVKIAAGENWHEFVIWCIDNGFAGLENLSLIPGCVGASPMQNIGAYGVEIKERFKELEAFDLKTGERKMFSNEECKFGYRESIFKNEAKGKYLITSVFFTLNKNPELNISYGAIASELHAAGVLKPDIRAVSDAVVRIRKSKLPNPAETGNAGSFFKNPEVSASKHDELKKTYPELVSYALPNSNYKLAAGWLIEQCGLKGYEHKGAAVHDKQALVLVNKKNASGNSVYELSTYVLEQVNIKFGVQLEREVNIV